MNIKAKAGQILKYRLPRHELWAKGSGAGLTVASVSTLILCSGSIIPPVSIFGAATAIETLYNRNQAKKILNNPNKTVLEKLQILSANTAITLTSPVYHISAIGTYYYSKLLGLAQVISDRTGLSEQTSKLLPTNIVAVAVNPWKEGIRKTVQDSFVLHPPQLEAIYKYFPTFTEFFTGISEKQFLTLYSALDPKTLVNSNNTGTLKEELSKGISKFSKTILKILNTEIKVPEIKKTNLDIQKLNPTKLLYFLVDGGLTGVATVASSECNVPSVLGLAFSTTRQRVISQFVVEQLNSPTLKLDMAKTVTNQGKLLLQWLISSGIEAGVGRFINDETVSHEVAGNLKALVGNVIKVPTAHCLLTPVASYLEKTLYKRNLKPLMKIPKWLRDYLISPNIQEAINKLELEPRFRSAEINLLKYRK